MALSTLLQQTRDFPDHVEAMVEKYRWGDLIQALEDGLPANLISLGDVSLFELVLAELEMARPLADTGSVKGPLALLDAFVKHGLKKGRLHESGMTAVGLACTYGQWQWSWRLMEAGYTIEIPESSVSSVLHTLIEGRFERMAEDRRNHFLDEKSTPQTEDIAGHLGTNVKRFSEKTPRPDLDRSPRRRARVLPKDTEEESELVITTVLSLKSHGADIGVLVDPEKDDTSRLTPLGRAIWTLDAPVTQALLEAGADMGQHQNVDGCAGRPLELALYRGNLAAVKMLTQQGAPVGRNPALSGFEALTNQPLALAACLGMVQAVPLIVHATSAEEIQIDSCRAMQMAASRNRVDCMKMLHLLGVPYDVRTQPNGFMPLHQAASTGAEEAIHLLLEQGATWDNKSHTDVSCAEMLRTNQPLLAVKYGMAVREPGEMENNVHFLKPRSRS